MKGFIVDRTYRIIEGKSYVYLFGRLENGDSFLTINAFKPFFYIKKHDLPKATKMATCNHEEGNLANMEGEPVTKIILEVPRDVPVVRKAFEEAGIACYEADIPFTQRFLMAHDIRATLDIHGTHKQGRYVSRIYEEPLLTPVDYAPRLMTLSLDIETSADGERLYCIGLATAEKRKTLFLKDPKKEHQHLKVSDTELFDEEKPLLERFATLMQEWDPDIVTGWNLIDFDLADLKTRFDRHKVPFILGRAEWPCTVKLESSFMRDSSAEFPGRMVLDGIHLLKSSFISLDDYKLETAAQEFLGEGKLIAGQDRGAEIERLYKEEPAKLVAYNRKDAELVLRILDKTQLIELTAFRSALNGVTMERVRGSIASFDSVYIRAMNKKGLVAPSGSFTNKDERIKGGFVRESKPGIYDWIVVLDFKSMYPSVIRSFNIDPVDFLPGCKEKKSSTKVIVAPNGACFKNEDGLLPTIIQHLWEERDKAKRRKDPVASQALKTLMNSFFGVLASPNCRFFNLDIANAITAYARHFIQLTAEKIEKMGYEVIYSDTDSVFIITSVTSLEEAKEIGENISARINTVYEEYVRKEYHRVNFMEIQSDKIFRKFLMPTLRGSEEGAKKRYAGLRVTEKGERVEFTGLEFVRRDWTELAKKFQMELLDRIFHEQEVTEYIKKLVNDVKAGKHDDLLVYRKSIRKELEGYTKTTPPHVKAARILEQKGALHSTIIEYVMTLNGPEPIGHATAAIDYDHYIEKQIRPLADSILSFYGTSFDDLVKGSSQKTLFGY
jgi:DNA polymerase-2